MASTDGTRGRLKETLHLPERRPHHGRVLDPVALNPFASVDDGSCIPMHLGAHPRPELRAATG